MPARLLALTLTLWLAAPMALAAERRLIPAVGRITIVRAAAGARSAQSKSSRAASDQATC